MTRYLWSLAAVLPVTAFAQADNAFQCTLDGDVRRVEIVYETGVAVPCEVHYYKDTEAPGEREILWTARNESGYCESRTRDFIAQLRSWGWTCEGGTPATAPPTAQDDTDVLGAPDAAQ